MSTRSQRDSSPPDAGPVKTPFMSGLLHDITLPELVQMFASRGYSVRIQLAARDGRSGLVIVEDGMVGRCEFDKLFGEDAFFALCRIGGTFAVYRAGAERESQATVSRSVQDLLIEAATREDEERRDSSGNVVPFPAGSEGAWSISEVPPQPQGGLGPISEVHSRPEERTASGQVAADDGFDDLFAAATRAYLVRDIDLATALFRRCVDLRPDDPRIQANLESLERMRKNG